MEIVRHLILGAGISSMGAAYGLKEEKQDSIILEKDDTYGGLCGNFEIDGFRFDRFIHLSFTADNLVNKIFEKSTNKIIKHTPNPSNLYKGIWVKHPAQNNTYPLPEDMKSKIIANFAKRPNAKEVNITNYEQWLRIQYGDYFAECFPMVYTKKYWMREAKELETKWVGIRCYQPSLDEVIQGSKSNDTPITYYAKEMRYPQEGGYKSFLNELVDELDIRYGNKVRKIDEINKIVSCENGSQYRYDKLISSLPLPEVITMLDNVPQDVLTAMAKLKCTSGYLISIGLKTPNIPPYLWWYIYDEDILPARVYSPSLKSPDNAPKGCSSLQMEVYCNENDHTQEELYAGSVAKLIELGIIEAEDILFVDIRFERYANVIFDHNIYESREKVRDYLTSIGITTIGRFGEWDYLWSDQSLLSGLNATEKLIK